MFPILYQYKFISIGGYGLMLGLGFYLSFLLGERECKFKNIDQELAYKLLLFIIPSGIIGSKIFHILDHLNEFFANPWDMLFSGAGLSAYGGYVLAFIVCAIVIKMHKVSILDVFDAAAPGLALGYCFGRFGCQVAGDGCYGEVIKSYMPFKFMGTAYPNGLAPISAEVYPTPLFEVFFSFVVVGLLLQLRKREWAKGKLFFLFLVLSGLPRLLVEFIRTNPKVIGNLSQAQIIAIIFMIVGFAGWLYADRRPVEQ
jgi:phosphatidylglycerol---prolipoprotein diacylglyceryl transferase